MCMDLITSLWKSQLYDVILLMVQRLAKLAHMVSIMGIATMFKTTWIFSQRMVGSPRVAKSDCLGTRSKVHKCILEALLKRNQNETKI